MASKYDALANFLGRQCGPRHAMSFAEIERLIGTPFTAICAEMASVVGQ